MSHAPLSEPVFETHFELHDRGFTTMVDDQPKEYLLDDVIGVRVRFQDPLASASSIDRIYLRVQDPAAPVIEIRAGHSEMDQPRLKKLLDETNAKLGERIFDKLRDDQKFYNEAWVMSPTDLLDRTSQQKIPLDLIAAVNWRGSELVIHRFDTDEPLVLCDAADENTTVLEHVLRHIVDHGAPKPAPLQPYRTQTVPIDATPSDVTQTNVDISDPHDTAAVPTGSPTSNPTAHEDNPVEFSNSVTIKCQANVKSEPSHFAKGLFRCEISASGIRLTQRRHVIIIPRGQMIHYAGDNRIVVEYADHRLHLKVQKLWSYQERLARDIVAFMNDEAEAPHDGNYDLPLYLGACATLPIGIPIVTLGGALPAIAGVGLSGACFAVARKASLAESARLLLILAMSAAGYLATFALIAALAA